MSAAVAPRPWDCKWPSWVRNPMYHDWCSDHCLIKQDGIRRRDDAALLLDANGHYSSVQLDAIAALSRARGEPPQATGAGR